MLPLRIVLLVSNTLILGFLQPQARAHIQLLPDLGDPLGKGDSEPHFGGGESRDLRNNQCKASQGGTGVTLPGAMGVGWEFPPPADAHISSLLYISRLLPWELLVDFCSITDPECFSNP